MSASDNSSAELAGPWYLLPKKGEKKRGPFSLEELERHLSQNSFDTDLRVRASRDHEWCAWQNADAKYPILAACVNAVQLRPLRKTLRCQACGARVYADMSELVGRSRVCAACAERQKCGARPKPPWDDATWQVVRAHSCPGIELLNLLLLPISVPFALWVWTVENEPDSRDYSIYQGDTRSRKCCRVSWFVACLLWGHLIVTRKGSIYVKYEHRDSTSISLRKHDRFSFDVCFEKGYDSSDWS